MKAQNRPWVALAALIGILGASVSAQDSSTNAVPGADAAATETNAPEVAIRDPFWPVGYRKPDPKKEEVKKVEEKKKEEIKQALNISWPALDVTAVSKTPQGSYIAMIKGIGMVEEGDTVRVRKEGLIYRWKITTISEKGMAFKKVDATPIKPQN